MWMFLYVTRGSAHRGACATHSIHRASPYSKSTKHAIDWGQWVISPIYAENHAPTPDFRPQIPALNPSKHQLPGPQKWGIHGERKRVCPMSQLQSWQHRSDGDPA